MAQAICDADGPAAAPEIPPATRREAADGMGRAEGALELRFKRRDGVTQLDHLYQAAPLRALFPRVSRGEPPQAALTNTSGGLVGGDRLRIRLACGPGAAATAVTQAAEKVYRSRGADARIDTALSLAQGAWLEWLPQETILFQDARMRRVTRIELAPDARLLAGEILVFGRRARGETTHRGLLRDAWEVSRGGRPVWADALHLEGDYAATLRASAGFDGAAATAMALYAAPDAGDRLTLARDLLPADGVTSGATAFEGLMVVRWLARDPLALRRAFGAFWSGFRHRAAGLPDALPRLWHV
jgi:urease accessory protein